MAYIRPTGISNKLRNASKNLSILFVQGTVGAGKTAGIQFHFRRKKSLYLSARKGSLDFSRVTDIEKYSTPETSAASFAAYLQDAKIEVLIIDDLQSLRNILNIRLLQQIFLTEGLQVVCMSRGCAPEWLLALEGAETIRWESIENGNTTGNMLEAVPAGGTRQIMLADDEDLFFGYEETHEYIEDQGITLTYEDEQTVYTMSGGLPIYLRFILMQVEDGQVNEERLTAAAEGFYRYLDTHFFNEIDTAHQEMLLKLCHFPVLDVDFARVITADYNIIGIFDRMMHEGNYIRKIAGNLGPANPIFNGNSVILSAASGNAAGAAPASFTTQARSGVPDGVGGVYGADAHSSSAGGTGIAYSAGARPGNLGSKGAVFGAAGRTGSAAGVGGAGITPSTYGASARQGSAQQGVPPMPAPVSNNVYRIIEPYRSYLRWKYTLDAEIRRDSELFGRAAVYYQIADRRIDALDCLVRYGSQERLREYIVRLAKEEPQLQTTIGYLDDYMNKLTAETLYTVPVLMAARSMSYSLRFNPTRSEEWMHFLSDYAKRPDIRDIERAEANYRLAFLDLMLPHRSTEGITERLMALESAKNAWDGVSGFISLTGNNPSLMNGYFDLCAFHGEDFNAAHNARLLEVADRMLGLRSVGFNDLLRDEFTFETGAYDEYEMTERVNAVYMKADRMGNEEICFAAVGLITRIYLFAGNESMVTYMTETYLRKIQNSGARNILATIESLCVLVDLIMGNTDKAADWIEKAPDSSYEFTCQHGYIYLLKSRIFLLQGRFDEARVLIERLLAAFDQYHRPYMLVVTRLLKAILYYRTGEPRWISELMKTLEAAQEYNLCMAVAQEGAALQPLLLHLPEDMSSKLDPSFYARVLMQTQVMARNNPGYLRMESTLEEPLTETEATVLSMLCRQMTSKEMCQELHITYSGLKYHKGNIYRKLGVKGRVEAQRRAAELKLI